MHIQIWTKHNSMIQTLVLSFHILLQQGTDKGTLVFDNWDDSSEEVLRIGCVCWNEAGEQSQPQAPIPPSLRASEVFILGNGSVNVDKLSRGIYSIMRSFLKLPLNERLWMGKGSEILPLLCHQNGTVLINPVSPGRIFKFLFIF